MNRSNGRLKRNCIHLLALDSPRKPSLCIIEVIVKGSQEEDLSQDVMTINVS